MRRPMPWRWRSATDSGCAGGRIEWLTGDWFAPLAGRRFDAIASNPPYIASDDPALADDGVRHEPRAALTPGGDGLGALRHSY